MSITSDCDYWVVYDMPTVRDLRRAAVGPPDAFNLGGATSLEPGEELRRQHDDRLGVTTDTVTLQPCDAYQSVTTRR